MKELIAQILTEHIQIERNKRCICGWRPRFPRTEFGSEWFQHRDHTAEVLTDVIGAAK